MYRGPRPRLLDACDPCVEAWCNVSPSPTDVSLTENSWISHPLDKVSLGCFAPDQTIPSPNLDFLIFLIIILGGLYGCD
jgi:hypothetical protein